MRTIDIRYPYNKSNKNLYENIGYFQSRYMNYDPLMSINKSLFVILRVKRRK